MSHLVEDFGERAGQSIEAMKQAAIAARSDHAAAELARHLLTTARKFAALPRDEAIEEVVSEWMGAWHLNRADWPGIAAEMEALTGTFYDYAHDPSDRNDQAVRAAWQRLKAVHDTAERTLEDQMAWRSVCAHGWWADVSPSPSNGEDMPNGGREGTPFWTRGCPPECIG